MQIIRLITFKLSNSYAHGTSTLQTDSRTDDSRQQYRALHYVHCAVYADFTGMPVDNWTLKSIRLQKF